RWVPSADMNDLPTDFSSITGAGEEVALAGWARSLAVTLFCTSATVSSLWVGVALNFSRCSPLRGESLARRFVVKISRGQSPFPRSGKPRETSNLPPRKTRNAADFLPFRIACATQTG